MNNKKKKYLDIISKIQKIRQSNNKNCMDLLRLSFIIYPEK